MYVTKRNTESVHTLHQKSKKITAYTEEINFSKVHSQSFESITKDFSRKKEVRRLPSTQNMWHDTKIGVRNS